MRLGVLDALAPRARALVGTLRQCVRWESSGNRQNWNLRSPDGWIYARHLKQKYGKSYITKQEWARQNGTWKGAEARELQARPSPAYKETQCRSCLADYSTALDHPRWDSCT